MRLTQPVTVAHSLAAEQQHLGPPRSFQLAAPLTGTPSWKEHQAQKEGFFQKPLMHQYCLFCRDNRSNTLDNTAYLLLIEPGDRAT